MCRNHATVRSLLAELVGGSAAPTVADMEAGLEHFSRATPRYVDSLLVVVEPYFRSLETGARAAELGRELGIARISVIANKVRTDDDRDAIGEFCEERALSPVGWIPFDEAVSEAERAGRSLVDFRPQSPALQALSEIAKLLMHGAGRRWTHQAGD